MKLREIMMFLIVFNCFMFLWTLIGMPGFNTPGSSYNGPAFYIVTFGVGAIIAVLIVPISIAAIANYSSIPLPNERSVTYAVIVTLFGGTLASTTGMVTNLLKSMGIGGPVVGFFTVLIAVGIGIVFMWTVIQWTLGGGESIQ